MSINVTQPLDADLQIQIFLTDLKREALPQEIFDKLSDNYVYSVGEDAPSLPNAIYLKLDAKADEGRTVKVPMVKDLYGDPTLGAAQSQVGGEEDITTKHFDMQYTDLSHATTNQAYGIYARDKFPFKLFEQRVPLLGRYFKQYFGKMRRQALLECHSENLHEDPHFLPHAWSPNWYIPGLPNSSQPIYDPADQLDDATWTAELVAAMNAAGLGSSACASIRFFQRLEEWASTEKLIRRITFEDGTEGYVFILPTPQATWLKHAVNDQALGGVWQRIEAFSTEVRMMYPGLLGQLGAIRFVEDPRYATLTLTGTSSGSGRVSGSGSGAGSTMTAQYRGMGNADDGSSDPRDKSASARQVGWLLGQAALCEWMPEGFHWEWQYQQYDKYFGSGVFCSVGVKQVGYDNANATPGVMHLQQQGSICVPFAPPPSNDL